ncbi:hypothetical protein QE197_22810 (plasmid) [Arsenophonus nasoniae]|uniref:Uncharacterized protein n=1 Tax=Arsenophonus nasoniae TaxID=638 RepID=D2U0X2_9GAMM|nr:hypothetical protein [Arsenophonus nasoniae]QBY46423.1 hypothetical protein ArsFIN_50340 [Arsenophonus nasoniae]QBY46512.1 hypothetical protein ArsFIN_51230 [Arsenophonus nasoniae]WGM08568.1 hypothetical protein QE258_24920 [Arsenophonus nasoniae]WGM13387.1 hypothetical protein QE197_22810 [Arsenophonus nasoniae]WGM17960.1 hypothetical protein QE193_22695 [Arsenophonus nasoniae]
MKMSSINTIYDFMRYCRMPLYFQRSIRDMKVGDTFILGKYTQPASKYNVKFHVPHRVSVDGEAHFVAEAWIEKERGFFSFYATWTFPTKTERSFIMVSGKFRVRQWGLIDFDKKDDGDVKHFALVCRYLMHILNKMTYEAKKVYFEMKSIPLFNGVWLDRDFIERRPIAVEVDGKIKPVWVSYKHYLPTPQLSAIVEAASALELFDI